MPALNLSEAEWNEISDGIDKLLVLESQQDKKAIYLREFNRLADLLLKIEKLTGHKAPLAKRLLPYTMPPPYRQMTKRR